jgi:hypothetical protein
MMRRFVSMSRAAALLGSLACVATTATAQPRGCPPGADPNCVTGIPQFGVPATPREQIENRSRERQRQDNSSAQNAPAGPRAPSTILRERARLDEVQNSGAPPEEQARVACRHLFAATYRAREADQTTWTTVVRNSDIPYSFALRLVYFQVRGVGNAETVSSSLSPADIAEGFQYKGRVTFRGTMYRILFERVPSDGTFRPELWRNLWVNHGEFAVCDYVIRGGRADIDAVNEILYVSFDKLSRPDIP